MKENGSVLGLATIRQNRGISLAQIADETKISVRSLEAIERGEFGKLPGGIYNTSYIRQYARAIDYDESAILSYYHQATGSAPQSGPQGPDRSVPGNYRPLSSMLGS
jgi:cytoskeletal protein RodZ